MYIINGISQVVYQTIIKFYLKCFFKNSGRTDRGLRGLSIKSLISLNFFKLSTCGTFCNGWSGIFPWSPSSPQNKFFKALKQVSGRSGLINQTATITNPPIKVPITYLLFKHAKGFDFLVSSLVLLLVVVLVFFWF